MNYTEPVDSYSKTKQNRARQETFRRSHPDYHREWVKRVGYPTTATGRAAWSKTRETILGLMQGQTQKPIQTRVQMQKQSQSQITFEQLKHLAMQLKALGNQDYSLTVNGVTP